MEKVLVSACLIGQKVRYHGGDAAEPSEILARWQREGRLVPLCPEVVGGLPVPRPPAELRANGRIETADGTDVTPAYEAGAAAAIAIAQRHGIRIAVLKENSPSCGSHAIYDGTFSGQKIAGQGLTAKRLLALGLRLFSEAELAEADDYLRALEDPASGSRT